MIDTHCHVDFPQFNNDRVAMFTRAEEQGVIGLIQIEIDPGRWGSNKHIDAPGLRVWRTAGIHPNSADRLWNDNVSLELRDALRNGSFVGVGETGIDLFRSGESLDIQRRAFEIHLDLATELDLPVVIHQRAAEEEVLEVLRSRGSVKGVMHCFGGDWDYARACLETGLHLGIGGVSTFPSATETRDAIRKAPQDRLLLETDAPYLAPQPVRGKRNESAYLEYVVETIGKCRRESVNDVAEYSTANAVELFGLEIS